MFVKAGCSVSSEKKCGTCSLNDSKTPREMSGRCGNPWGKKTTKKQNRLSAPHRRTLHY